MMLHPIFDDEPTLRTPETPADFWQVLTEISPFEVVRELPTGFKPSRSCFYPCFGFTADIDPFVFIHRREGEHWNSVRVLAHEVGHALDRAGLHPALICLGMDKKSNSRYRQELAAVAFCEAFLRGTGLTRQKGSRTYIKNDRKYMDRHKRPFGTALYKEVLKATQAAMPRPWWR